MRNPKDIIVKESFEINSVLNNVFFHGRSRKLQVFKVKGTDCCSCSAVGTHFSMVIHPQGIEMRLHTLDTNGKEGFLTVDHIQPVSKGGSKRSMKNLQSMCDTCNQLKSNKEVSEVKTL